MLVGIIYCIARIGCLLLAGSILSIYNWTSGLCDHATSRYGASDNIEGVSYTHWVNNFALDSIVP